MENAENDDFALSEAVEQDIWIRRNSQPTNGWDIRLPAGAWLLFKQGQYRIKPGCDIRCACRRTVADEFKYRFDLLSRTLGKANFHHLNLFSNFRAWASSTSSS